MDGSVLLCRWLLFSNYLAIVKLIDSGVLSGLCGKIEWHNVIHLTEIHHGIISTSFIHVIAEGMNNILQVNNVSK